MSASRRSLAQRANPKLAPGCARLFFVPFLLIGLILFYALTIRPALKIIAAQSWVETPCVIDSSAVASHRGNKGSTYSVEIAYHYTFEDRNYTSSRYHFATGTSSGRKAKQAIVNRYPPGKEAVCFVDPAAPDEAVLDRGWHWELALGGIGLIFALIGGLGFAFAGRFSRNANPTSSGLPPATVSGTGVPGVLRPKYAPLTKFLGMLTFAVVWNGFIGTVFYLVFFSDDRHVPIVAWILFSLFGLVGIALLVGSFSLFLALFNPRIRVTAAATTVPLGGELSLSWVVTGRSGMLRRLRIILEGFEEAHYRRGTSNCTDRKVFAEIPVFESSDREFLTRGSARVVVPPHLMHTFEASHNKVLWQLKVQGEIPSWPDVADEYPISVIPLPRP